VPVCAAGPEGCCSLRWRFIALLAGAPSREREGDGDPTTDGRNRRARLEKAVMDAAPAVNVNRTLSHGATLEDVAPATTTATYAATRETSRADRREASARVAPSSQRAPMPRFAKLADTTPGRASCGDRTSWSSARFGIQTGRRGQNHHPAVDSASHGRKVDLVRPGARGDHVTVRATSRVRARLPRLRHRSARRAELARLRVVTVF